MQPNIAENDHRTVRRVVVALIAAILAVYAGVVHCEFIRLDDPSHVVENPYVRAGLTIDGVRHAFAEPHASLWVPLTAVSFMADVSLFGMNPAAMHFENVVWHCGAAVLLFLALRRLTARLWPSAFVAALFGVHPINVESVAWVAERKNVLCAFFAMLALFHWARWVLEKRRLSWGIAHISFAAALLAKPMAVTLPCVIVLLDFWPLRRIGSTPWRQMILEKAPFFALSAFASLMATRATIPRGAIISLQRLPLDARITNAFVSYGAYLRDLVWPQKLAVFYPHPGVAEWLSAAVIGAGIVAVLAIGVWKWRRHPYWLIGWLIFFGMLVPNLGFVQVGTQARADRFAYFAQVGFFIAMIWTADAILPAARRIRVAAATGVLLALSGASIIQVTKWESSLSLFEHAVYVTKDNAMALENAAYAYSRIGDIDTAIQRMEESLRVFPENAICWNELGAAHMKKGYHQLAARDFRNALLIDARDSVARCNFATALTAMGELSGAENELRELIAAHPTMAQAHFRYGLLLEKLARKEEALARLREANRLEPANPLIGEALARFTVKSNE